MAAAETITIHLNYKKVLREVFFHYNKKRSTNNGEDYFDMFQIYEYVPESELSTAMQQTLCTTNCDDESKLIKVLLQLLQADSGEMQQLIRSFFKKSEFDVFATGDDSDAIYLKIHRTFQMKGCIHSMQLR